MSDATLIVEIKAQVGGLKTGMAEAQTAVRQVEKELKPTGASGSQSVEHVAQSFKKLENEASTSSKAISRKLESELSGAAAKVEASFSEVGKEAGKEFGKIGSEFSKSGGLFGKLGGSVSSIAAVAGPVGMIGAALAAAGAAGAGISAELADMAQESQHLAEAAGLSVTKLVEWKGVLNQAGVPAQRVTMMMQHMGTAIFEATVEKEATEVRSFQALEGSQKDLAGTGGDLNKVLLLLSNRLQHTKMTAATLGAASELLGRNSAQLIGVLRQGPDVIAQEMAAYKNLGEQEEKSKGAADEFKAAESVLMAHIEGVGFPILRAMPTIINGAVKAWDGLKAAIAVWWDVVSPEIKGVGSLVAEVGRLIWRYIGTDVVKAFHVYERAALEAGKVVVAAFATAGATAEETAQAVRDAVHGNFAAAWNDMKAIPAEAEKSYRATINKIIADTQGAAKASDEFKKQVAAAALESNIPESEMQTHEVDTTKKHKAHHKKIKEMSEKQESALNSRVQERINKSYETMQQGFEKEAVARGKALTKEVFSRAHAAEQEIKAKKEHDKEMTREEESFKEKMLRLKIEASRELASSGQLSGFMGSRGRMAAKIAQTNELFQVQASSISKEIALEASTNGTRTVRYKQLQDKLAILDQQRLNKIQEIKNREVQMEKQKNDEITSEMQEAFGRRYGFQNMMAEKANAVIRNSMSSAMSILESKLGMQMAADKKSQLSSARKGAAKAASEFPFPLNIVAGAATFAALMAFKGGGIVPETSIAMVHKNELVLPAHIASHVMRTAGSRPSDTPGGAGEMHFHYSPSINAIDGPSVEKFSRDHAEIFASAGYRWFRQKNRI